MRVIAVLGTVVAAHPRIAVSGWAEPVGGQHLIMQRRVPERGDVLAWIVVTYQIVLGLGLLVFFGGLVVYFAQAGVHRWLIATPSQRMVVSVVGVALIGAVLALVGNSVRRRRARRRLAETDLGPTGLVGQEGEPDLR